jgi:hypothetical protein
MDLDSGDGARERGEQPREERDAGAVEGVSDAMHEQRVNPRPGCEDLERAHTPRGGITAASRPDVAADL